MLKNIVQGFIVDIGASRSVPSDPCYPFITGSFSGLCIEGDPTCIPTLKSRVSSEIQVHNGYVTPDNILDIFSTYNVPIEIGLLKIDIDGYDLEVLRVILSLYRPKVIIAEINEKIPPPIKFEVLFKPDYIWDQSHCFGFSLAAGEEVLKDYSIVQLYELNNLLAIRSYNKPVRTISEIYQQDYVANTSRLKVLPWNANVNHWLTIKDTKKLNETIEHYFSKNNDRSKMKLKKFKNVDFLLN